MNVYQRCGNIQWSWWVRSLQTWPGGTHSISVQRDQVDHSSDLTAHPHTSLISESLMMTEARRNKGSSPVTFEKIMSVKYFCSLNHGGAMIALHKMESLRPSISKITRDAIRTPGQSQFRTRNRNFQQIKYQVFRGFRRGSSDLRFQIYL